jgi:hypothetical protein
MGDRLIVNDLFLRSIEVYENNIVWKSSEESNPSTGEAPKLRLRSAENWNLSWLVSPPLFDELEPSFAPAKNVYRVEHGSQY